MRRSDEDTEELRHLLRSADQGRNGRGPAVSSSTDRQINELASLLGAIEGPNVERRNRPSLSSSTMPPQPPSAATTAASSSRPPMPMPSASSHTTAPDSQRNYRTSQVRSLPC